MQAQPAPPVGVQRAHITNVLRLVQGGKAEFAAGNDDICAIIRRQKEEDALVSGHPYATDRCYVGNAGQSQW